MQKMNANQKVAKLQEVQPLAAKNPKNTRCQFISDRIFKQKFGTDVNLGLGTYDVSLCISSLVVIGTQ